MPLADAKPATSIRSGSLIRALLIGESGSGKTTSACTIPGQKLLIDIDGRAESISGFENLSVITIKEPNPATPRAWVEILNLKNEIWAQVKANKFPYDAVIVDSCTTATRYGLNWTLGLTDDKGKKMATGYGGTPAQPHYMPQMHSFSQFCLSMLALPVHVIFTAHLDLHKDEELGKLFWAPKVTGKLASELPSWFNETYLCSNTAAKGGKSVFTWTTAGVDRYGFLKSSLNKLGKVWTSPLTIDFDNRPTGFAWILQEINKQHIPGRIRLVHTQAKQDPEGDVD